MTEIFGALNERQREAADHRDGPLLIVAGAGAGKTKTIVHRIANLIESGIEPRNILAVTFTNKAAKEMSDRVRNILAEKMISGSPFIATFHSLGVNILKENAELMGRKRYFSILDKDESMSFLKRSARSLGLDPKDINIRAIQNIISKQKNNLINLEKYLDTPEKSFHKDNTIKVWRKYNNLLLENEAYDFDDLVLIPTMLLQNRKDILEKYQNRWTHIHVDEYQDTNTVQYEFSRLLADKHKNICVVGDSDQAIYGWRNADFRNILNFEQNFPGAKTVILEENYRSTKNILDLANRVIQKNRLRKEKNLFTRNDSGEKITIFEAIDENDEAMFIARKSRELINKGVKPEDIAVLYRANFQSRVIEEGFLKLGLPYQVLGARFYERKEVKDLVSFIKLALNPKDKEALSRIINIPPRGIGKLTLDKIFAGKEDELPVKTKEKISEFWKKISRVKEILEKNNLSTSIKEIIKEIGFDVYFLGEGSKEDGVERLENLRELSNIATKYDALTQEEALDKFLTDFSLMSDQDSLVVETEAQTKKQGIRLMTVHASKGLEFKFVFVVGLEQDLFPHRSFGGGDDESSESDNEEERRLFYVAVTRAKEKLFLSWAVSRMIFGQRQMNLPSEFLGDIDDSIADVERNESFSSGGQKSYNKFSSSFDSGDDEDTISWDCLGK